MESCFCKFLRIGSACVGLRRLEQLIAVESVRSFQETNEAPPAGILRPLSFSLLSSLVRSTCLSWSALYRPLPPELLQPQSRRSRARFYVPSSSTKRRLLPSIAHSHPVKWRCGNGIFWTSSLSRTKYSKIRVAPRASSRTHPKMPSLLHLPLPLLHHNHPSCLDYQS